MVDETVIPDGIIDDNEAWAKLNAPVWRIANNLYRIISEKYQVARIFVSGRSKVQFNFSRPREDWICVSARMNTARRGQLKYYTVSIFCCGFSRSITTSPDESRLVAMFSSVFAHF
jgi:hypothetical protein